MKRASQAPLQAPAACREEMDEGRQKPPFDFADIENLGILIASDRAGRRMAPAADSPLPTHLTGRVPMNHVCRLWYLLILVVALAPAATRVALRQRVCSSPVDPVMAQAGKELFLHEWKVNDPLCPEGDGLGPVYNATSCIACHRQGGTGGGGGASTTSPPSSPTIPTQSRAKASFTHTASTATGAIRARKSRSQAGCSAASIFFRRGTRPPCSGRS